MCACVCVYVFFILFHYNKTQICMYGIYIYIYIYIQVYNIYVYNIYTYIIYMYIILYTYVCTRVIFQIGTVNLNSDNTDYGYMHVDTSTNTTIIITDLLMLSGCIFIYHFSICSTCVRFVKHMYSNLSIGAIVLNERR